MATQDLNSKLCKLEESLQITQQVKNAYDVFVHNVMKSQGLNYSDMTPLNEWAQNRFNEFSGCGSIEKRNGFGEWITKRYSTKR